MFGDLSSYSLEPEGRKRVRGYAVFGRKLAINKVLFNGYTALGNINLQHCPMPQSLG